jgi:hypothetical protein
MKISFPNPLEENEDSVVSMMNISLLSVRKKKPIIKLPPSVKSSPNLIWSRYIFPLRSEKLFIKTGKAIRIESTP